MNFKQRLLSAMFIPAVAATTTSLGYLGVSLAQEADSSSLAQIAQILWQPGDGDQPDTIADRAVYSLDDPALQFIYSPNQFVVESFRSNAKEATKAPVNRINVWSKEDYVTLANAGEEVGDFPVRLTLSIYENSESLPLEDWITTQLDEALNPDIETIEGKTIAGQEGLTFTRGDVLTSYQSTVLKDATGDKVIMISIGGFIDADQLDGSAGYSEAFGKIESSLRLTNASVDEYKE